MVSLGLTLRSCDLAISVRIGGSGVFRIAQAVFPITQARCVIWGNLCRLMPVIFLRPLRFGSWSMSIFRALRLLHPPCLTVMMKRQFWVNVSDKILSCFTVLVLHIRVCRSALQSVHVSSIVYQDGVILEEGLAILSKVSTASLGSLSPGKAL